MSDQNSGNGAQNGANAGAEGPDRSWLDNNKPFTTVSSVSSYGSLYGAKDITYSVRVLNDDEEGIPEELCRPARDSFDTKPEDEVLKDANKQKLRFTDKEMVQMGRRKAGQQLVYRVFEELNLIDKTKEVWDRFGDDLSELILDFLPLEDKIRLQCVSNTFYDVIFTKHDRLYLNPITERRKMAKMYVRSTSLFEKNLYLIKYDKLEYVLKKCPHLTSIIVDGKLVIDSQFFNLVAQYCPHLQYLILKPAAVRRLETASVVRLGRACGGSLRKLKLAGFKEERDNIRNMLSLLPNLEDVTVDDLSLVSTNPYRWQHYIQNDWSFKPKFLPNLKRISCHGSFNLSSLSQFQREYFDVITSIDFETMDFAFDSIESMALLVAFGHFKRLEELKLLRVQCGKKCNFTYMGLKEMCRLMSSRDIRLLHVTIRDNFDINVNLLEVMDQVTSLVNLKLLVHGSLMDGQIPIFYRVGTFRDLRHLTRLKSLHLEVGMTEDDLQDLDKYLPQLESFYLHTPDSVSDPTFLQWARLKRLKQFFLYCINLEEKRTISDFAIKEMWDNCPNMYRFVLRSLTPFFLYNITCDVFQCVRQHAANRPKQMHYFILTMNVPKKNPDTSLMRAMAHIPRNLFCRAMTGHRSIRPSALNEWIFPVVIIKFCDVLPKSCLEPTVQLVIKW